MKQICKHYGIINTEALDQQTNRQLNTGGPTINKYKAKT